MVQAAQGGWALQEYDAKVHAGSRWDQLMTPVCLAPVVVLPLGVGVARDCVASDLAPEGQLVGEQVEQVALLAVPVPWVVGVHGALASQWHVLLAGQLQQLEEEEGGEVEEP